MSRVSYITKKGRRSILIRPECINAQTGKGDMEMDLIIGKGGKEAILTLVDRLTGYLIIEQLPQGNYVVFEGKAVAIDTHDRNMIRGYLETLQKKG